MNKIVLVFATNNAHKVAEIKQAIGERFQVMSLEEAGIQIDIPEPHATLEANATEKSATIYQLLQQPCFSEDTGLETEALNGEPGVKSARYAGEGKDFRHNTELLLQRLAGQTNRRARFRTVISLIWNGREHLFQGICPGHITTEPHGTAGFGYDPVFVPEGSEHTFAQMSIEEKNRFSHRKKATDQLILFLQQKAVL